MTESPSEPRPGCPICQRPDPHGQSWACCPRCVDNVDVMLRSLLDAHIEAATHPHLALPAARGNDGPTAVHRDPPLPLDLAVLELAVGVDILTTLEQWERWIREEFGLPPYGIASASRLEAAVSHESAQEVTLCGVIRFLRAQWPLWASKTEPPPEEFAHEVQVLHTQAQRALRRVEPRPWTFPCPADLDNGSLCGYRLRVDYSGRDVQIHCPRCSTTWSLERLVIVGRAAGTPAWVDAETAARYLGCDVGHLGPMVRDGKLRRRGDGEHRRYDINSLQREAAAG